MLSNHFRPHQATRTYPRWMTKKADKTPPEKKAPKAPPSPERIEFGARLTALREARQLTQKEVAQALEVAGRGTVWAWEHGGGAPDAFMLRRLAEFYDVSADALLWGERLPGEAALLRAFRKMETSKERAMLLRAAGVSEPDDERSLRDNIGEHAPAQRPDSKGNKSQDN